MVRFYLAEFHKLELPGAEKFFDSADYVTFVLENPNVLPAAKQRLAYLRGEIDSAKSLHGFTHGMGYIISFGEAVSQYKMPDGMMGRKWSGVDMDSYLDTHPPKRNGSERVDPES